MKTLPGMAPNGAGKVFFSGFANVLGDMDLAFEQFYVFYISNFQIQVSRLPEIWAGPGFGLGPGMSLREGILQTGKAAGIWDMSTIHLPRIHDRFTMELG